MDDVVRFDLVRIMPDGSEYTIDESRPILGGGFGPRGPGHLEFVKAACRYCASVYARSGIVVRHRILAHTPGAVFPIEVES